MNLLIDKQCRHYSSKESALSAEEIEKLRSATPAWAYDSSENALVRVFAFDDYYQTIGFVNKVAEIAHQEDHHPQLLVTYNQCRISYNTHTVNGVTENEFICAAKIDQLLS
ncbi:MAG: 4a-hydroxytetrahydrobiopterin dehydratase [Pseudomonadota bacterium]